MAERKTQVMVRMSNEEKAEVKRLADSHHTSISNYIRMVILNSKKVKLI